METRANPAIANERERAALVERVLRDAGAASLTASGRALRSIGRRTTPADRLTR